MADMRIVLGSNKLPVKQWILLLWLWPYIWLLFCVIFPDKDTDVHCQDHIAQPARHGKCTCWVLLSDWFFELKRNTWR